MKLIILLGFLMVIAAAVGDRNICRPLIPLIANECNSCTCPDTGKLEKISCEDNICKNDNYIELRHCNDRSTRFTWKDNCNRCWCVADRGTICENKTCFLLGTSI